MMSLYNYFDEIVALKPITSRPASAERYVVCTGFCGIPTDWDGPTWMNSIFLGRVHPPSNNICHQGDIKGILDDSDRDILDLNLKACFSILSYLERKAASVGGDSRYGDEVYDDACDQWKRDCPKVNVGYYKYAWKLA